MLNYRKIAKVLLVAAFFCTFMGISHNSYAQEKVEIVSRGGSPHTIKAKYRGENYELKGKDGWESVWYTSSGLESSRHSVSADVGKKLNAAASQHGCPDGSSWVVDKCVTNKELVERRCSQPEFKNTEACKTATGGASADKTAAPTAAGSNAAQKDSGITGCSKNLGLFSGLIETGRKIFTGLRDLIYVVAGFGIIGVAVGGFFGNLNWKWLGAIIIGLIVIATTGELINAITGCPDYTSSMITDTLK